MTAIRKDYIVIVVISIILHLAAIYLYASGFLITSIRINTQSECNDPLMTNTLYSQRNPPERCWTTPIVEKTALYLVDALRYDFAFTADFPPLFETINNENQLKLYHNNMDVFNILEKEYPSQSGRYHFIPDPPTTTAQRVKAMTTGGVPAFIEVSNTFNNVVVDEDSLVNQFKKNGLKTVFSGDSLWVDMFPDMFDDISTGPSLDIADLHSVDLICDEALKKHQNESKFDVMITHFLGVDHIGHYYQPDHPVMQQKLVQINSILNRSLHLLPEKTLALVFGDHGVTEEGNHGGSTLYELDAALFSFDNRKKEGETINPMKVSQVDIVPTIAIAMGLPIPYSNTGTPMRDIILGREMNLQSVQRYVNALNITTNQIIRFLYENANKNNRKSNWVDMELNELKSLQQQEIEEFDELEELIELMDRHEKLCRELHDKFVQNNASFKFNYMMCGIILMIVSLMVIGLYILGYPQFEINILKVAHGFILGMVPALLLRRIYDMNMPKIDQYIFFSPLLGALAFISNYASQFNDFVLKGTKLTTTISFDFIMACLISFIYGFGQYTDSYIKEEKYTSYYVAQCLSFVILFFAILKRKTQDTTSLLIHVALIIAIPLSQRFPLHYISLSLLPIILYSLTSSSFIPSASLIALIYHLIKPYPTSWMGIVLPDSIYVIVIISLIISFKQKSSPLHYLCSLIPFMTVILPSYASTPLLLLILSVYVFKYHDHSEYITLFFVFISMHFFFLTGHAFQFSDIQFNAGFIGIPFFTMIGNGILIILNTFFFPCAIGLAIASVIHNKPNSGLLYIKSSLFVMMFFAYQLLSIMIFTYFVYGHLEIFRIFTPKVCFDAIIVIVLDVMIFLVYFAVNRSISEEQTNQEKTTKMD